MIIIYIFGGLLLLFLLLTVLAPAGFKLVRKAELGCTTQQLINYVSNFNNYTKWNTWLVQDESLQIEVSGVTGKRGHMMQWKGERVGKGKMELISVNENSLGWTIQYEKPWKSGGTDIWQIKTISPNKCEVTWSHEGQLPWPFARLMGGFIRRSLGVQYESALQKLNEVVK